MSTEELLAVLDMTEDEQKHWLREHKIMGYPDNIADLAFRLRDEVINDEGCREWENATAAVYQSCKKEDDTPWDWWMDLSKPIHWIIAVLIAKEMSK